MLRTHEGVMVAAHCTTRQLISNPTVVEAVGAWVAVDMCRQLGITHVILEGDSLEVVQAIQKEGKCWSIYGHLINDTKSLL